MSAVRYIFVTDQGRVFSSTDGPTAEDLEYAKVGILTIVSLSHHCYYGHERQWLPIPVSRITSTNIDGEESAPFHDTD